MDLATLTLAFISGFPISQLTPASPHRSSPLANPPIQAGDRRRPGSGKIAIPRKASHHAHSPSSPLASQTHSHSPSNAHQHAHHSPHSPHSPRASIATHAAHSASPPSSSPLSRSHPLLGSYPLSLLHARMATHKSHCASQFALRVRAIATKPGCPGPRAPTPLVIPFSATYYDLVGEDEPHCGPVPSHSPWVADVDLEAHFFAQYAGEAESSDKEKAEPPAYPGYRVPQVGQLQLLIKTPTTAVHAFVVPYDLSTLAPGARLLARERTYVSAAPPSPSPSQNQGADTGGDEASPNSPSQTPAQGQSQPPARESLRYAVQLQFACVPDADADGGVAYYVGRTLKLVFTSSPPESGCAIRNERADEVVPPATATPTSAKHTMRGSALRKSISSATPLLSPSPSPSPSAPSAASTSPAAKSSSPSSSPLSRTPQPSSPPSPAPTASRRRSSIEASTEWAQVRAQWRMRAAKAAAVARGFDPPTSRPVSPVPAAPSPRSLLSALAPDGERRDSPDRPGSEEGRSSDGDKGDADAPTSAKPARPTTSRTPSVAGSARRRLSREERELSERLRAMDLGG